MNRQIRDVFLSLTVVVVVVGLILLLFQLTGNIALVTQLLQSTAEGNIVGIAFTSMGPFGMFVISFLLINRFSKQDFPLEPITLYLFFSEQDFPVSPPLERADYSQALCWYTVFSDGREVKPKEDAIIRFDDDRPFITINPKAVKNPSFDVKIEYEGHQFMSDSFSPISKTGRVALR